MCFATNDIPETLAPLRVLAVLPKEPPSSPGYNITGGFYRVAALMAHQAAEKCLKAVWSASRPELWRTHDLVALAEGLKAPQRILDAGEMLNPHYISSRYPTGVNTPYTEEDALEALAAAEEVVAWARSQL